MRYWIWKIYLKLDSCRLCARYARNDGSRAAWLKQSTVPSISPRSRLRTLFGHVQEKRHSTYCSSHVVFVSSCTTCERTMHFWQRGMRSQSRCSREMRRYSCRLIIQGFPGRLIWMLFGSGQSPVPQQRNRQRTALVSSFTLLGQFFLITNLNQARHPTVPRPCARSPN